MNNNQLTIEKSFNIIGIGIRTSNEKAFSEKTIQKLWQDFFAESIYDKIPNKIDNAIVAVYYNFENDYKGDYNLLLGARTSSVDNAPAGMIIYNVSTQARKVFVSEVGPWGLVCFNLWKKIWLLEDQHELNRTYIADYELYDERSKSPNEGKVSIHIGLN